MAAANCKEENLNDLSSSMMDGSAGPQGRDDDVYVHLNVGGFSYTTTRKILLSTHQESDKENYFHALLSKNWAKDNTSTANQNPIVIPDRDGRLFFYILYYLQLGEIPHKAKSHSTSSILPYDDCLQLKAEADYFGLGGLKKLLHFPSKFLSRLGDIGDLDVKPYSCVEIIIQNVFDPYACNFPYEDGKNFKSYTLKYTFGGSTLVNAKYFCQLGRGRKSYLKVSVDSKIVVDFDGYKEVFQQLQIIITNHYDQKKTKPAVSEILSGMSPSGKIPPELRLWWAMEVQAMTEFYEKNKDWKFPFESIVDFLVKDRDWARYDNSD